MARSGNQQGWSELLEILNDSGAESAAVQEVFPDQRSWSYNDAIEFLQPAVAKKLHTAGKRWVTASLLEACPILAVAGKLNAGKTSLVSSFLSPQGRTRALRGEANFQGTHRFALWLPSAWRRDGRLYEAICTRIGDALGETPEELSLDPKVAHQQYNNREGGSKQLNVPLITTDEGLDHFGLGFLDCPDTDTSERLQLGSPEERLELLKRAAPLCSAFLVVAAYHAIRDARLEVVVQMLAEAMPNLDRFLAINMVRPRYAPHEVRADLKSFLERNRIKELYVAYDYEIQESNRYRPAKALAQSPAENFPEFFRPQDPVLWEREVPIENENWLRALPKQLNAGEMFQQLTKDLRRGVYKLVKQGLDGLDEEASRRNREMESMRKGLLDAALSFFVARWDTSGKIAEMRVLHNQTITRQLIDVFSRTAPWYAKLPLMIQNRLQVISSGLGTLRTWLSRGAVKDTVDQVKDRLRVGRAGRLLTAESLEESLREAGVMNLLPDADREEANLRARCQRILVRLEQEMTAKLDEAALEQAALEVWKNVPAGKKLKGGLTGLGIAIAAFGAVLLVPLDGGGSAVLAAASIKELLGAAGLSVGAAWWSGQQFQKAVAGATAVQQLADFYAALADGFGVPRAGCDLKNLELDILSGKESLPPSALVRRLDRQTPLTLYRIRRGFRQRVDS